MLDLADKRVGCAERTKTFCMNDDFYFYQLLGNPFIAEYTVGARDPWPLPECKTTFITNDVFWGHDD